MSDEMIPAQKEDQTQPPKNTRRPEDRPCRTEACVLLGAGGGGRGVTDPPGPVDAVLGLVGHRAAVFARALPELRRRRTRLLPPRVPAGSGGGYPALTAGAKGPANQEDFG